MPYGTANRPVRIDDFSPQKFTAAAKTEAPPRREMSEVDFFLPPPRPFSNRPQTRFYKEFFDGWPLGRLPLQRRAHGHPFGLLYGLPSSPGRYQCFTGTRTPDEQNAPKTCDANSIVLALSGAAGPGIGVHGSEMVTGFWPRAPATSSHRIDRPKPFVPKIIDAYLFDAQAELDGLTNGCLRGPMSAAGGGRRHGAAG